MDRVKYIANIAIIALLFLAIAIQKDGRIAGRAVDEITQSVEVEEQATVEESLADGTRVIYSTSLAKDIIGYGGRTPIKLYVRDGVIERVEAEPNDETPSFFDEVRKSGLLDKWNGVSLEDAATLQVDGVSGATYSAEAIIGNVQRAAQYGAQVSAIGGGVFKGVGIKEVVALLVILMGAVITLAKWRNKWLVTLQMVLNVGVLGFWCGSFLSLTTFVSWAANGFNIALSLVTVGLFAVALIMPLFGRKGSYCYALCPMGAAQEIVGKVPLKKWQMRPEVAKFLNRLRYYILLFLLFMMWIGIGFDLMNYEIFSAFIFGSASTVVLVMAAIFLLLTLFIPRPYCRFVCPTGALLTISQKTKE